MDKHVMVVHIIIRRDDEVTSQLKLEDENYMRVQMRINDHVYRCDNLLKIWVKYMQFDHVMFILVNYMLVSALRLTIYLRVLLIYKQKIIFVWKSQE